MEKNQIMIYKITLTAAFSAVAFALMFIEISLPIIPAFIKFDISDLPALIGAFAIGPVSGMVIELLKNILHILIKGTSSAFVGELSNFLLGAVFCLTAGLIYKRNKTKKTAVIACLIGALTMGIISLPLNYFLVYPAYVNVYHMPLDAIIGMYQAIMGKIVTFPSKNALLNCLLIFNVPFTFFKGVVDSIICLLVYKPLSKFIKGKAF